MKSQRTATMLQELGRARFAWDMDMMDDLPKILGNADPMHYTQLLPGVQTNNEYDSGLHIYGCDNLHNEVSVNGVPLYNVSHLLGLFSVFNATHYPKLNISKTIVDASFPNRLGGTVSMSLPNTLADTISGAFAVGLMSSQGTLRLPVGKKSMLSVSARLCYLNKLYGYALKADESQMEYDFWDMNATWMYRPGPSDTWWVDVYWGGDKAGMNESNYQAEMGLKWGNKMVATHWEHLFDHLGKMKHSAYYTGYECRFTLDQQMLHLGLPSSVEDIGYKGQYEKNGLKVGMDLALHRIKPQTLDQSNIYGRERSQESHTQHTQEYAVYVSKMFPLNQVIALDVGLRGSAYIDDNKSVWYGIDPSLSLLYSRKTWEWGLTLSQRHQYLYQTGFSSKGLPTEFWTSTNSNQLPQRGLNLSATFSKSLFEGRLRLSLEAYLKFLEHQTEYNGSVLDLMMTDYQLDRQLLQGKGRNYGINLTLIKPKGFLTGWIGYHIGKAERKFDNDDLEKWYPANHDRLHELNAVGNMHLTKRLTFGATFVYASGTPYTAPRYTYLYAGYLISQYSEHNDHRLKPYIRLDLSVNYSFRKSKNWESGLNLSVYNALARKNELFYTWRTTGDDSFVYQPVSFLVRIMPSISYYAKF